MRPGIRLVLAGSFASYSQGGGHQSVFLQYLLGLKALGHDVFWFDLLHSTGDEATERQLAASFFCRLHDYGLQNRCVVLAYNTERDRTELSSTRIYGMSPDRVEEIARNADLLWNFCGSLRPPLLSLFSRRALIDLDPGLLQVCSITWDMGLQDHHAFLTVGKNLHQSDCDVPTLGLTWKGFVPFVYLPLWEAMPDPGERAPFSSVTEWTWHTITMGDRLLSASKRDAYLRYVELPQQAARPFEIAANIHPEDRSGDRELLQAHGWQVTHPHRVAASPSTYRNYIQGSRAEIACSKPIYAELKTGWLSDRSVCYLACARPVLAEETGFSTHLPTGKGLISFSSLEEGVAGVAAIDAEYERHRRAARELAEEFFDSRRCLEAMLAACA